MEMLFARVVGIALMIVAVGIPLRSGLEGVPLYVASLTLLYGSAFVLGRALQKAKRIAITLGADGILLQRMTGRTFISYSSVESASRIERFVTLVLTDGTTLSIDLRQRGRAASPAECDRLVATIEANSTAKSRAADHVRLPAREGHSIAEWLRDVRRAPSKESYRAPSLTSDALLAIVEDPSVPLTERAAATIALRERCDATGAARVRVAIDAYVSPRAREVLTSAWVDDEEIVARKLAAED